MITARRAVLSTALLASAGVASRLTLFIVGVWISASLGPFAAGRFFTAFAFVSMFAVLPDFGVSMLVVREGARKPAKAAACYGTGLALFGLTAGLTYALMLCGAWMLRYDAELLALIAILSLVVIGKAGEVMAGTGLQLNDRLHWMAAAQGLGALLALGGVYWCTVQGAPLLVITGVILAAGVVTFSMVLAAGVRQLPPKPKRVLALIFLRRAWPFGLSNLLATVYLWAGVVVLSKMRPEADVGQFTAAYRLNTLLYMIPTILLNQVLARSWFAAAQDDPQRLAAGYRALAKHLFAGGVCAAVLLFAMREPIILWLYGGAFLPAVAALGILCWVLPMRMLATAVSQLLTVTDHQRLKVAFQAGLAGLLIVASLVLTPRYGFVGLCAAVVVTEAALLGLYLLGANRKAYPLLIRRGLKPLRTLAAGGLTLNAVLLIRSHVPLFAAAAIGAAVFVLALLVLRFYDAGDLARLRTLLRHGSRPNS